MAVKLDYSAREVAARTGLTARQLQWWDRRGIFPATVPSRRTDAGGFTERRYARPELLELMVLAELRRRRFSMLSIRRLLTTLREQFGIRLHEALEGGGPIALFLDGRHIYARTAAGRFFNVLEAPTQPLLMVGPGPRFRQLTARERPLRSGRSALASRASRPTRRVPR